MSGLKIELEDIIYSFAASDAIAIENSKNGHGGSSNGRTHRSDPVRAHAQYNYPTYHTGDLSEETIAALIAQLESAETSQAMSGAEAGEDGEPVGGSDLRILLLEQLNAIGQLRSSNMTEQSQEQLAGGALSGTLIPTNRTRERERDRAIRVREGRMRQQQDTLQIIDDAFAMGPNQSMATGGSGAPRLIRRPRDRTGEEGQGFERGGYRSSGSRSSRGRGPGIPPGTRDEDRTAVQSRGNVNEDAAVLDTHFEEGRGDEEIGMSQRDRAQMRAVNISLQADEEAALNMAILLSLRERPGQGERGGGGRGDVGQNRSGREFQDSNNTDNLRGNGNSSSAASGSAVQSEVRSASIGGAFSDLSGPTPSEIAAVAALELTGAADPSEGDIQSLISMGFGRKEVIKALKTSGNDIEIAADILLSGTL